MASLTNSLCNASASGQIEKVLLLLQAGADVNKLNKFGRTALQVVRLGHSALVKALLDVGADPNARDRVQQLTVTHDAAREGFLDSVRVLIDHGADANQVDQKGNLPLHLAAREGHLEVVKLLLEHTVDSQVAKYEENTALMLARDFRRLKTAEFIEEHLVSHLRKGQ